jgi:hypothetical protein
MVTQRGANEDLLYLLSVYFESLVLFYLCYRKYRIRAHKVDLSSLQSPREKDLVNKSFVYMLLNFLDFTFPYQIRN